MEKSLGRRPPQTNLPNEIESENLNYELQEANSPMRQVAAYSAPIGLSGIAGAIAYYSTHGVAQTILALVSVLLLYGLIVAIREVQVTRQEILSTKLELRKNARLVRQIGTGLSQVSLPGLKPIPISVPVGMLEVYIDYKAINVGDLGEVLSGLQRIYKIIYGINYGLESDKIEGFAMIDQILRGNPGDRLQIAYISTEESIRLRCKTGWLPKAAIEDDELNIYLPKGLIALISTGSLLGGAITWGTGEVKDINEIIKTRQEIQLKQKESEKVEKEIRKLDMELEELRKKIEQADPQTKEQLQLELKNFMNLTVGNDDITGIKIRAGGGGKRRMICIP
jgi:hypothetical protein